MPSFKSYGLPALTNLYFYLSLYPLEDLDKQHRYKDYYDGPNKVSHRALHFRSLSMQSTQVASTA